MVDEEISVGDRFREAFEKLGVIDDNSLFRFMEVDTQVDIDGGGKEVILSKEIQIVLDEKNGVVVDLELRRIVGEDRFFGVSGYLGTGGVYDVDYSERYYYKMLGTEYDHFFLDRILYMIHNDAFDTIDALRKKAKQNKKSKSVKAKSKSDGS